ncbi:tyrosine-type recombinase/integrase [Desulfurivibrio sp. C05AmB]|uniref:tyrosine-type recombinase/integrase n=1 Tax=Desulfurivibrio sp. C05AmB TaxID=3374371 RepID=UPI00376EFB77
MKRNPTGKPGVTYRINEHGEKIFYVRFKRNGKVIEAKAGGSIKKQMTAAKAATYRALLIAGKESTPQEQREQERAAKDAEQSKPTLARLWEAFKAAKADNKSLRDDLYRWRLHLEPPLANKTPAELVTLDIDRLRSHLLKKVYCLQVKRNGKTVETKKKMAPATVKQVLVLLKRIINHAVKRGLCPPVDPSRLHFELPKINNEKTEDLSPEELARLLEAIDNAKDWRAAGVLRLAMLTGMRRGELLALRWEHIDLERGFLRIVEPKGGRDASIPLNAAARRVLAELPRTESPFLFPGRGGNRASDLKKPIQAIKKAAGLPADFRPCHGLRHFFASSLASSGQVDLYTLQRLLTHKSAAMTARYAHLRDEALQAAAGVMDDLLLNHDR